LGEPIFFTSLLKVVSFLLYHIKFGNAFLLCKFSVCCTRGTTKVLIENLNTSDSIRLSWRKFGTTLDWREKLVPIYSGASYRIKIWRRKFTFEKEISLYQVPPELKTIAAKAKWMKHNGCQSQAEMLLNKVKSSF
jgi:hypothetical protein